MPTGSYKKTSKSFKKRLAKVIKIFLKMTNKNIVVSDIEISQKIKNQS